jgi:proteasome accessory factor B
VSLNLAQWDQAITFHTTAEPAANIPPLLETLTRAAQKCQQLRLRYRKPGARLEEERVVDPYQLANVNGDWYLFAFDHLRKDLRRFVPSRIITAEPTGATFSRPAQFELEKLLRDSFGVHSREGDFEVVLRFEEGVADYIREKRWHPSQALKELKDGGVEMQLRLGSLNEIERWILGWGGAARVMSPPELVDRVRRAADRLRAVH